MIKTNFKTKNNLFIVESPFQLLSAIEARNMYTEDFCVLIIKYDAKNKISNKQMFSLKNFIYWDNIIEIKPLFFNQEAKISLFILLLKNALSKNNYYRIFIGEFRSIWMRSFINTLNPKEHFVLDDGNVIIELQKKYLSMGSYPHTSKWDDLLWKCGRLIISVLHINYSKNSEFDLFTCFNIIPNSQKQKVLKHNFEYLKLNSQNKEIKKHTVYFFGGNLSETGIISEDEEISLLNKIIKYYRTNNYTFIYIPHRRENVKKIKRINDCLGSKILRFKYPAEYEFIISKSHPEIISSFFSTALYTVSQMFTFSSVDSFIIPHNKVNAAFINDTSNIYKEYMKSMNMIQL